jgi:Gpi18-like mannosyltransferase
MSSGSTFTLLADAVPAEREVRAWWTLAAVAALLRAVIMPYGGFPVDIGTFKAWSQAIVENGPAAFYGGGFADYLPGYLYILWVIGEINQAVHFSDQAHLFALKLPAALADIITAGLIFIVARRWKSSWALPLAASYLFNPGIVFNSAYWGQADAVGAAFALAGVGMLGSGSPIVAAVLIALGAVIKPQTAPVAIPAAIYLLRTLTRPHDGPPRWDLVLGAGAAGAATLVLIMLPFHLSPLGLIGVLRTSLSVYPFSSVVAFNFWGATMRFWVGDEMRWFGVPHYVIGMAATLAGLGAVAVWAGRHPTMRGVVLASAVALLVTFMLPTRIHERYLLPAIPFAALAAAVDRRMAVVYAGLSVVFVLNLVYAYSRPYVDTFVLPGWLDTTVFSEPATRVWSALAMLMLVAAFYVMFTWRDAKSRVHQGD